MCHFLHIYDNRWYQRAYFSASSWQGSMIMLVYICTKKALPYSVRETHLKLTLIPHSWAIYFFSFCNVASWIYLMLFVYVFRELCVIIFLSYLSMCNLLSMRPKNWLLWILYVNVIHFIYAPKCSTKYLMLMLIYLLDTLIVI